MIFGLQIVSLVALACCGSVFSTPIVSANCTRSVHFKDSEGLVNQNERIQYVIDGQPLAGSVPAHLGSTSTFYRAVIRDELDYLNDNYPIGGSPPRQSPGGGDFTVQGTGGLYVFDVEAEAVVYGRCNSVTPIKEWPYFYIVTFQYKPNSKLSTKSFTTDDDNWRTLVENCEKNIAHSFAAVEGPYSMRKNGKTVGAPQQGGGTGMLWQAAFIGQDALKTLTVTNRRKVNTREGQFPACTIF